MGHTAQRGALGRHTVEPRSISAAVQSAGRSTAASASASAWSGAGREPGRIAHDRPTEDPPDVRVDGADRPAEGDREDRPRGVRPDTGQPLEVLDVAREAASELVDDDPGGPLEVERPTVVTEPAPGAKDVGGRRGRQRLDGREPTDERVPRRRAAGDLGLLEDRLRHEHQVRVRRAPERELATLAVVPVEDRGADGGDLGGSQERTLR